MVHRLFSCGWFLVVTAADIYDEASGSIRALGLDTECLGGGRIEHFPDDKLLKVYGHSTVSIYTHNINGQMQ